MRNAVHHYYLPQLNGIRSLVIIWVVLDHLSLKFPGSDAVQNIVKFAWLGTELLFIHATFIFITLLHIEHRVEGRVNIMHFYLRRILRIVPVYYFYIFVIVAFYGEDIHWNQYMILRCIGLLSFTDNIMTAAFGTFNPIPMTPHLYTISYLMQLYILIPAIYCFFAPLSTRARLIICGGILLSAMLVRAMLVMHGVNRLFIPMLFILRPEFMLGGMLLAFESGKGTINKNMIRAGWGLWGTTALLLFIFMIHGYGTETTGPQIFFYPLATVALGGVFMLCIRSQNTLFSVILSSPPLSFLGKIILGFYIYHYASIAISAGLLHALDWHPASPLVSWLMFLIAALVVTIVIATVSYHLLELRFLKIKERYTVVHSRPT